MNEKGGRGVEEKNSLPPSETIINKGSLRDLVEVEVKKKKKYSAFKRFSIHSGDYISIGTKTDGERPPKGTHCSPKY